MLKNMNFPEDLVNSVDIELGVLFGIAKWLLLFKVYEIEVVESF